MPAEDWQSEKKGVRSNMAKEFKLSPERFEELKNCLLYTSNYVVISHGDGTSSLYAHMSKRGVSAGQVVNQGDTIGYVGSTGNSTGNHLHLEIRVNGTRVNPEKYWPNLPFYRKYNE